MTVVAKVDDWDIHALPEQYTTLKLDILLDETQSDAIRRGVIPDDMGEKWFCYFDNNTLYQHRSWSGHCIDVIEFVAEGNQLRAVSARVNRDASQYSNTDDAEDVTRITEMLDWLYQQQDW